MNIASFARQLRELNGHHPASWPRAWRHALLLAVLLSVLLAGWQFFLASDIAALERDEQEYAALKSRYAATYRQAASLAQSGQQMHQAEQRITALEQQLQTGDDIDAVLSEIGDAAQGRRLQFELAKPGRPQSTHDDYVETPITLRLAGGYHDIGRFSADLAAMTPAVILGDLHLSSTAQAGTVTLEAVARVYRRRRDGEEKS